MVIELKAEIITPKLSTLALGQDIENAFANFMLEFIDLILKYAQEFLEKETNQITGNLLKSGRTEFDRAAAGSSA